MPLEVARKIAVKAQAFELEKQRADISTIATRLGCIQIDALSPVRRSHELVLLSRGVPTSSLDSLFTTDTNLCESWAHAHSLISFSVWQNLSWQREYIRKHGLYGPPVDYKLAQKILKHIEAYGPITISDLGKVKGKGWNRTSPIKTACEWLLSIGELIVLNRNKQWQRIYRTPEQSPKIFNTEADISTGLKNTISIALKALGIATEKHIRDYIRIPKTIPIIDYIHELGYIKTYVSGSTETWYTTSKLIDAHSTSKLKTLAVLDTITPISPLDSLVWTRERQKLLFGKDYILEAYKPQGKRQFGYYGMPLLLGHNIVGRVSARCQGNSLTLENLELDTDVPEIAIEHIKNKISSWVFLKPDISWDTFRTT